MNLKPFCTRPVPSSRVGQACPLLRWPGASEFMSKSTKYRCDNCGSTDAPEIPMEEIHHLAQRLDIGGVVPAGECGHCGALTYWVGGPCPDLEAK